MEARVNGDGSHLSLVRNPRQNDDGEVDNDDESVVAVKCLKSSRPANLSRAQHCRAELCRLYRHQSSASCADFSPFPIAAPPIAGINPLPTLIPPVTASLSGYKLSLSAFDGTLEEQQPTPCSSSSTSSLGSTAAALSPSSDRLSPVSQTARCLSPLPSRAVCDSVHGVNAFQTAENIKSSTPLPPLAAVSQSPLHPPHPTPSLLLNAAPLFSPESEQHEHSNENSFVENAKEEKIILNKQDGAFAVKSFKSYESTQLKHPLVTRNPHTKPPFSYATLIAEAILSTTAKKLTLSGIYAFISSNYAFYRLSNNGWQVRPFLYCLISVYSSWFHRHLFCTTNSLCIS